MGTKDDVLLLPPVPPLNPCPASLAAFHHLASQYLWLSCFSIFLFIYWILPDSCESGPIQSAPSAIPWRSSEDPIVFGHLTDVHINSLKPESSFLFGRALAQYVNLSISTLIVTGDLVDNWGDLSKGHYGHQYEPDYVEYTRIWQQYRSRFRFVGDIAGNHDEFGLFRLNSSDHFLLKRSLLFQTYRPGKTEGFWAAGFDFGDVYFIAINPFRFPTPHAKFDFWARQTTELLDAVEFAIGDVQRKLAALPAGARRPAIVFGCHYPVAFWVHPRVRSSSGRTFVDLISSCNASMFLSGHTHPRETQYVHHDGLLEAVGVDLTEHNGISIITMDNGRLVHHSFPVDAPPRALLTYPVPEHLLSNVVPFRDPPTEIRAVSRAPNLTVNVGGSAHGRLQMSRPIAGGWYLYSCPLPSLASGRHRFTFSGDWESAVNIFVGDSLPSFRERIYHRQRDLWLGEIGFWFVLTVNFVILMPGCFGLQFGPRARILALPIPFRVALVCAFLAPLVLPLSLIEIEGRIGVNCWYGYAIAGHVFYDLWGQIFVLVYEGAIVLPAILFASMLAVSEKWRAVFALDIAVAAAAWAAAVRYEVSAIGEAAGEAFAWASPLFVIFPILFYAGMIIWRIFAAPKFFRGRCARSEAKRLD